MTKKKTASDPADKILVDARSRQWNAVLNQLRLIETLPSHAPQVQELCVEACFKGQFHVLKELLRCGASMENEWRGRLPLSEAVCAASTASIWG